MTLSDRSFRVLAVLVTPGRRHVRAITLSAGYA